MSPLVTSLAVALVAYTLFGIAMVMMKAGSDALKDPKAAWATPEGKRALIIWALGVSTNLGFAAVLAVALGYGHASVVAALNGFGLVVVAVLSRVFLGERINGMQAGAIATVIVGVFIIGLFASPPSPGATPWDSTVLAVYLSTLSILCLALVLGSRAAKWARAAPVLGAVAGALGGAAMVMQKIFVVPFFERGLSLDTVLEVGLGPYFWMWSLYATLSFIVLQFAYRFGDASLVAPMMTSAMILAPIIGGFVVFGETISAGQLAGTVVLFLGALVLAISEAPQGAPQKRKEL